MTNACDDLAAPDRIKRMLYPTAADAITHTHASEDSNSQVRVTVSIGRRRSASRNSRRPNESHKSTAGWGHRQANSSAALQLSSRGGDHHHRFGGTVERSEPMAAIAEPTRRRPLFDQGLLPDRAGQHSAVNHREVFAHARPVRR